MYMCLHTTCYVICTYNNAVILLIDVCMYTESGVSVDVCTWRSVCPIDAHTYMGKGGGIDSFVRCLVFC